MTKAPAAKAPWRLDPLRRRRLWHGCLPAGVALDTVRLDCLSTLLAGEGAVGTEDLVLHASQAMGQGSPWVAP